MRSSAERARYRLSAVAILPMGIIEPTEYRQFAARLAMGDVVIIYTDAIAEARNPAREMLGERELLGLAQHAAGLIPSASGELEKPARETGSAALARFFAPKTIRAS